MLRAMRNALFFLAGLAIAYIVWVPAAQAADLLVMAAPDSSMRVILTDEPCFDSTAPDEVRAARVEVKDQGVILACYAEVKDPEGNRFYFVVTEHGGSAVLPEEEFKPVNRVFKSTAPRAKPARAPGLFGVHGVEV